MFWKGFENHSLTDVFNPGLVIVQGREGMAQVVDGSTKDERKTVRKDSVSDALSLVFYPLFLPQLSPPTSLLLSMSL